MPFMIAKSNFLRAFKNSNYQEIDVLYRSNNNSWSISEIFNEYDDILNFKFKESNRKILILLDNFSGHKIQDKKILNFIFSSNCTSIYQALNMGIIKFFKPKYWSFLNNYLIAVHLEANDDNFLC